MFVANISTSLIHLSIYIYISKYTINGPSINLWSPRNLEALTIAHELLYDDRVLAAFTQQDTEPLKGQSSKIGGWFGGEPIISDGLDMMYGFVF